MASAEHLWKWPCVCVYTCTWSRYSLSLTYLDTRGSGNPDQACCSAFSVWVTSWNDVVSAVLNTKIFQDWNRYNRIQVPDVWAILSTRTIKDQIPSYWYCSKYKVRPITLVKGLLIHTGKTGTKLKLTNSNNDKLFCFNLLFLWDKKSIILKSECFLPLQKGTTSQDSVALQARSFLASVLESLVGYLL